MKSVRFTVFCSGIYEAVLDIESDFDCGNDISKMTDKELRELHSYICYHLSEAKQISDIEWIADIDVEKDDIKEIICY